MTDYPDAPKGRENKNWNRTWIYHKTEKPKIVHLSEAQEYYDKGWADTPAAFFDMKSHGLDPDNQPLVQSVGEQIKGVTESLNGALNLENMTTKELVDYADYHFNKKLKVAKGNKRLPKGKILEQVKKLVDYK